MMYRLPDNYGLLEYGWTLPSAKKMKRAIEKKRGRLGLAAGRGVTPSAQSALDEAMPFRGAYHAETGRDTSIPPSSAIEAAKARIEQQQLQQAAALQDQGKMVEAQSIIGSNPLDAAAQKIEAERAQLAADRADRDAKVEADNLRNKRLGLGLAVVLSGVAVFMIMRK
jgi:CubicO group peptidase (beta-lactamase class C family)